MPCTCTWSRRCVDDEDSISSAFNYEDLISSRIFAKILPTNLKKDMIMPPISSYLVGLGQTSVAKVFAIYIATLPQRERKMASQVS